MSTAIWVRIPTTEELTFWYRQGQKTDMCQHVISMDHFCGAMIPLYNSKKKNFSPYLLRHITYDIMKVNRYSLNWIRESWECKMKKSKSLSSLGFKCCCRFISDFQFSSAWLHIFTRFRSCPVFGDGDYFQQVLKLFS